MIKQVTPCGVLIVGKNTSFTRGKNKLLSMKARNSCNVLKRWCRCIQDVVPIRGANDLLLEAMYTSTDRRELIPTNERIKKNTEIKY